MKNNKNIFICAILVVLMLFCVSAVSATDSNLDVATGVALNDVTEGDALSATEGGSNSGDDLLAVDNPTVTNDTFFKYFDKNGVINKSISSSELTFNGNFSGLGIDTITIDTPKTILGDDALFKNIGFKILSENVTLKGIAIDTARDGAAIDVHANDVTVDGVTVDVANAGEMDSYGVYAFESDNFNLVNSVINFNATGTTVIQHVVEIRNSNNVKVKKNEINANLPALDVDYYSGASGIDMDLPLAIGIQDGENITIDENIVTVDVTKAVGYFPTLDSLMANGPKNLVISNNAFTQTDFSGEGKAGYSNVVDLYSFDGAKVSGNTILVNTTTGTEGAGTAYAVQATGPYAALVVDGNKLTAQGKGPALGVYSQNYLGGTDITVTNNVIDVQGFATNDPWALVSGMELQDDKAVVSGNTINVNAINNYSDSNNLYGISYAQPLGASHTYNITNNTVYSDSLYAIYISNAVNSTVKDNTLIAHNVTGNKAANILGEDNVVEKNVPPTKAEIIIDAPAVWTGSDATITVNVTDATGNVSIRVGNKIYPDLKLVNSTVSQAIDASDLTLGANDIQVTYNGDDNYAKTTADGNLQVIDGVITADTFKYYFDKNNDNYLSVNVPEGATLDFQGTFVHNITKGNNYTLNINKPVNVISSTNDAVFENYEDFGKGETGNKAKCFKFNVRQGANYTNITGITIINGDLFVEAPHVTVDGITAIANMTSIGASTGFIVFITDAAYGTIKNSYLENGGTGSSIIVYGYGAPYGTIDNNVINVTGSSGNLVGANAYVGTGVTPGNMIVTNNQIYNEQASTSTSFGITLMGSYNVVENNTLRHKGSGILSANVQWASGPKDPSENNTYRNNVLIGCGISATKGSLVENNTMTAALSLGGADMVVIGNTAGSMTVGTTSAGGNITVDNNTINGAVTINKAATGTIFTNNLVKDAVTVNSNENTIEYNQISTEKAYAIDLKTSANNTVRFNVLSSKDKMGDDAVNSADNKGNTVKNNGMNAIIEIEAANSWSGDNNTINITVVNATGTVNVNINGNEYKNIPLVDNKASFAIPANNIEVGLNDLTVTYNGNKVISSDSKTTQFYGLDNVVFTEVFFDFFDKNGLLKDSVPYNDLIFKGAFAKAKTVQYIVLDKPVSISSDGASLSLMGIVIACDNVTIDGLKLTATVNSASSALGDLITVNANNVTLSNLDINYRVTNGNYDAIAINAFDADNLTIINNKIVFASVIKTGEYTAIAINLNGVTNALVDNNTITSTLPALTVDYDMWFIDDFEYYMMGHDYINPLRVRESDNITITNNNLDTSINNLAKTTPTVQSVLIIGSNNILFDSNTIKMIDTKSKVGDVTFLYALNFGYNDNLTVSNNILELSTKSGADSSGAAYGIQGVESNITVIGNSITTVSNGPNLGYYVSSMWGGSSNSYVANNFFNVTGNATSGDAWALVSGIEITNGAAVINNNTIYTYNKAGYVEKAPVHGVSYAQFMYGVRDIVVENNTIFTQGKYTVSLLDGTPANVTYNTLYAEELFGDDSVAPGIVGIVENNTPPFDPEIIIEGQPVWIGSNSTVTVTVPNATGNVTIVIGNKVYKEVPLVNGTVTVPVDAADLVGGANDVNVTYNGDLYLKVADSVGNLQVLDGVITNSTYEYYFDAKGNMVSLVPNGTTLDFQGLFLGKYPVYIDRPVNVISSTGDALFDAGATYAGNAVNSFNFIAGADNSNMTGLKFINNCLYIKGASNITVDSISIVANKRGVGSGTGFLCIHTGAYNTLVKNGYFENGGTGSSLLVLGKGGAYATFDHNVFNITGSSGNILSANQFTGSGAAPEHVSYTNNVLYNSQRGSAFCYAMTVMGSGNLVENNTIYHNGSGILNQYGATSTGNVYRNNTLYGNTNFNPSANSLVENNKIYATTNIAANTTAVGNTFMNVAISGTETVFVGNDVYGTVTVSGNENAIVDNIIMTTGDYAVDLKTTSNNTVTDNILYAKDLVGDSAVKFEEDKDNVVEDNFPIDPVLVVEVENIKVGENATINVSFAENITDYVEVIIDGKKYGIPVSEGKGQLNVSDLVSSKYTVGVYYFGDLLYLETYNSTTFIVEKLATNITMNISDADVGDDVNVTVDIPGVDGVVSIVVDYGNETFVPVVDGKGNFTIENIDAGVHVIIAVFEGNDKYAPMVFSEAFFVTKEESEINITIGDAKAGKDTNVTVSIPGATGNVSVIVDGKENIVPLDENGVANYVIPAVEAGEHGVVVLYNGDDAHYAAYENTSFSAAKEASAANVTIGDAKVGKDTNVAVSIPGATGNVSVIVDGKENIVPLDENGVANYVIPAVEAGDHSVVVVYSGDDAHDAAYDAKAFSVAKEASAANVTIGDAKVGKDTNVAVSIPGATGNVSVIVDGKENIVPLDENGVANYVIPAVEAGDHSVVVVYSGDDAHDAAYDAKAFSVAKEASAANVTIGDAKVGKDTNVSVSIPGATGNVSVIVDGKENIVPLDENGSATVPVSGLAVGDHSVVVIYSGDDAHDAAYVAKEIKSSVSESKFTNISVTGEGVISVVLVDEAGSPIANANVTYSVNGNATAATTGSDGSIVIPAASNSVVLINFDGNDKVLPVNTTITLKDVAKLRANTTIIGDDYETYAIDYYAGERGGYFKVKLVDDAGNILANKSVKIGFNGKVYNTTTDSEGIAKLQINLAKAGTYTFAVAFLGDKDYNASFTVKSITVNLKKTSLNAPAKSYKASAKTKSYTVTLKTDKGSSIDGKTYMASGKTVKLTVNGKTYTAKTNAKGQATFKLDINKKGTYNANVNFAGDNTYKSCKATTKITIN